MKAVGSGYYGKQGLATLALAIPVPYGLIICLTRLQGLRSRGQTLRKWPQDWAPGLGLASGSQGDYRQIGRQRTEGRHWGHWLCPDNISKLHYY